MATIGAGHLSRAGIAKESTYGTLVAPAELLPFLSENLIREDVRQANPVLIGKAAAYDDETLLSQRTSGVMTLRADYQATDIILGQILGGTWTKTGESSPYTHVVEMADDATRSVSLYVNKKNNTWEYAGCKVKTLTWTSNPADVTMALDLSVRELTRGSTHTATLDALTHTQGLQLRHQDATFRIADCADALASGDAVAITEFTMTLNLNIADDVGSTTSTTYIYEPFRRLNRELTISFTVPYHSSTVETWKGYIESDTKLQADISYGRTVSTVAYLLLMQYTTVKVVSVNPVISGAEASPVTIECKCYANNANTNMTSAEEMDLTIHNARSTAAWS